MPIPCICQNPVCHKHFTLPPSRVRDGRGLFCSKACQYAPTFEERFWAKVQKTPSCWLWTASRDNNGYGTFGTTSSIIQKAHRVAYELTYGAIPDGLFVCHACDNPPCVNPAHLWLGTHQDNMADAAQKGRMKYPTRSTRQLGEKNASAKLTTGQVYAIRALEGQLNSVAVGKMFHCTEDNIQAIWLRKSWKHLPPHQLPLL